MYNLYFYFFKYKNLAIQTCCIVNKLWLMTASLGNFVTCWTIWNGCDMHAHVYMHLAKMNSQWKFHFWCLNVTERLNVYMYVGKLLGFRKKNSYHAKN